MNKRKTSKHLEKILDDTYKAYIKERGKNNQHSCISDRELKLCNASVLLEDALKIMKSL